MTDVSPELQDEFGEGSEDLPRMTLLDHLDELRKRLFASVAAVFVAFMACWYFCLSSPQRSFKDCSMGASLRMLAMER